MDKDLINKVVLLDDSVIEDGHGNAVKKSYAVAEFAKTCYGDCDTDLWEYGFETKEKL